MSVFFEQLKNAELEISDHFLKFGRRTTGNYTKRQLSHFDGYILLVHGELEEYFENCANNAIDLAEIAIKKDMYNRTLYSLIAFHRDSEKDREGESAAKIPEKDIWKAKGHRAIRKHREAVRENHGVRTENLCKLLIPIGIDVRQIDNVLMVELDQFGQSRGAAAHSSIATRRGATVDPFVKKAEVAKILDLLETFDQFFDEFVHALQAHASIGPFSPEPPIGGYWGS